MARTTSDETTVEADGADGAAPAVPTATRSWGRDVVLVAGSVVVGLGLAFLLLGVDGSDGPVALTVPGIIDEVGDPAGPAVSFSQDGPTASGDEVQAGDGPAVVTTADRPATAEAAATAFLAAEISRDHRRSHDLLAPGDRATYPTPARWTAAHAQFVPITGFRIDDVIEGDDGSTAVEAAVRLESTLDPVLGLVPARATLTLATVAHDDGWHVDWSGSELVGHYPDPAGAVPAAGAWASATADCSSAREYEGGLFGDHSLVADLCAAAGPVELGPVGELPPDGGDRGLVASFGADVVGWARVVPVTSPARLDVVLAPVDDEWLVIAVLPPSD